MHGQPRGCSLTNPGGSLYYGLLNYLSNKLVSYIAALLARALNRSSLEYNSYINEALKCKKPSALAVYSNLEQY